MIDFEQLKPGDLMFLVIMDVKFNMLEFTLIKTILFMQQGRVVEFQ